MGERLIRGRTLADGTAVTALDVARAGVHAGAHHLRAAERVLERVRLLPRGEGLT